MVFKRILVPHDGSKPSEKAVEKAIELSKMLEDSHVILLHVIPELVIPPMIDRPIRSYKTGEVTTMGECYKEMVEEMSDNALKMLEKWGLQCKKDGISAETIASVGTPGDVILDQAKKQNIDVIVMGSTGLRGLSKLRALGSVARRGRMSCSLNTINKIVENYLFLFFAKIIFLLLKACLGRRIFLSLIYPGPRQGLTFL